MIICEVCGNEFEYGTTTCPYCDAVSTSPLVQSEGLLQRTVNLEQGMPTVARALQRLETELAIARRQGYRIIIFIHGYGSSGTGGVIKEEVQRQLYYYKHQGRINEVVPGEDFSSRAGVGRQLLRRFPALSTHDDLNRANRGITLVVL
jgi:hypothetical protein